MKPATLETIEEISITLIVVIFILLFFGGFLYLIYYTETQEERIYSKCLDNCERVFIEQRTLDCIQICNENLKGEKNNETK